MGESSILLPPSQSDDEQPERRRTVLIWLIFGLICYSSVLGFFQSVAFLLGWQPQVMKQYESLSPNGVAVGFGLVNSIIYFAVGLELFNLRARAIKLLFVVVAMSVAQSFYFIVIADYGRELPSTIQTSILVGILVSPVFPILILVYALRLRRRKILV